MSISVLILDGYPIVQWAIRKFAEKEAGLNIVGEVSTINEAARIVGLREPDVLVTELVLSDGNAVDNLARLSNNGVTQVVAFSERDTWDYVEPFLAAGGLGFVSKRDQLDDLLSAIRAVASKRRWVSGGIREPAANGQNRNVALLSRREREIIALVAKGLTSKQIAEQLCISMRTVENHRHRIFQKLGVHHCTQLVDFAVRHGL